MLTSEIAEDTTGVLESVTAEVSGVDDSGRGSKEGVTVTGEDDSGSGEDETGTEDSGVGAETVESVSSNGATETMDDATESVVSATLDKAVESAELTSDGDLGLTVSEVLSVSEVLTVSDGVTVGSVDTETGDSAVSSIKDTGAVEASVVPLAVSGVTEVSAAVEASEAVVESGTADKASVLVSCTEFSGVEVSAVSVGAEETAEISVCDVSDVGIEEAVSVVSEGVTVGRLVSVVSVVSVVSEGVTVGRLVSAVSVVSERVREGRLVSVVSVVSEGVTEGRLVSEETSMDPVEPLVDSCTESKEGELVSVVSVDSGADGLTVGEEVSAVPSMEEVVPSDGVTVGEEISVSVLSVPVETVSVPEGVTVGELLSAAGVSMVSLTVLSVAAEVVSSISSLPNNESVVVSSELAEPVKVDLVSRVRSPAVDSVTVLASAVKVSVFDKFTVPSVPADVPSATLGVATEVSSALNVNPNDDAAVVVAAVFEVVSALVDAELNQLKISENKLPADEVVADWDTTVGVFVGVFMLFEVMEVPSGDETSMDEGDNDGTVDWSVGSTVSFEAALAIWAKM